MEKRTKEEVLLDFEGTIVDSFELTKEKIKGLKGECFQGEPDFAKFQNADIRGFLSSLNIPFYHIPSFVSKVKKELEKNIIEKCGLFPGMKELIRELSENYNLGLVSDISSESTNKFLQANGIRNYFNIVQGESSFFTKHRDLQLILQSQGAYYYPSKPVYIGNEKKDIIACKRISLPIIAVTYGQYNLPEILKQNHPDFLANNPEEIKKALEIRYKTNLI